MVSVSFFVITTAENSDLTLLPDRPIYEIMKGEGKKIKLQGKLSVFGGDGRREALEKI